MTASRSAKEATQLERRGPRERSDRDVIEVDGEVISSHAGDLFHIDVALAGHTKRVLAKRSGRLHSAHIKVIPGDRVRVELSPYDTSRGRIVYRY